MQAYIINILKKDFLFTVFNIFNILIIKANK